jgi:hypothetical protein
MSQYVKRNFNQGHQTNGTVQKEPHNPYIIFAVYNK